MVRDQVFQIATSAIRFGSGCTEEIGMDLRGLGARRVMMLIDPRLRDLPTGKTVVKALSSQQVDHLIFDEIAVEPTDASFQHAAAVATAGNFDAFVAVGGGSTIDTAKAANLYSTWPADFFDYVNVPIGAGKPVPGPLKPLIAIPTTAGTGSETTAVAIFDCVAQQVKTGISHRYLRPTLGIIDPDNTRTMPAAVAACTGLDVLSHALESYTSLMFDRREKPASPDLRTAYQGANPISDVWSLHALELMAEFLPRACADTSDDEARGQMMLAAAYAGIGFGNAGVHLPHAMAYPVAGMVRSFEPAGYGADHPMVPHGMSVILHTPAVSRFTAPASPLRHLRAAAALGAEVEGVPDETAGDVLAERVIHFMKLLGMPSGLSEVGYGEADLPALVAGTLAQQRLMKLSPRPVGEAELTALFRESMSIW